MGLLDGRVAIVTGSGRGIGREFALCFASEGAKVVVNDVGVSLDGRGTKETTAEPTEGEAERKSTHEYVDPAAQVCKEIEALGSEAAPNYDSVSDFEGARKIVQTAVDAFGTVDILVNNAGIVRDKSLLKMDESDFDAVIAVHLKGTFNCTRHAAEVMKEKGYGRIVNITSSAGLRGNFGQTNYGAAKAGIMGMTFIWSMELGRYGITCNAVAPSGATRMTAALFERSGQAPPPEENPALNAPLVAYLASEDAGHVNGQILGRTEYAYTVFQHPKQVAWMWNEGGWTPARGGRTVRQGPRPASATGRHGDAQVDDEVTAPRSCDVRRPFRSSGVARTVMRWPLGVVDIVYAARGDVVERVAAKADGFAHIDPLLGTDPHSLALLIGCPTAFPKPVDTWCSTPAPNADIEGSWDRAVRWWRAAPHALLEPHARRGVLRRDGARVS